MLKNTPTKMLGLATWLVQGEVQGEDPALGLQTHGEMLASQQSGGAGARNELRGWADENRGGHHVVNKQF